MANPNPLNLFQGPRESNLSNSEPIGLIPYGNVGHVIGEWNYYQAAQEVKSYW